jgi:hypothetical protein
MPVVPVLSPGSECAGWSLLVILCGGIEVLVDVVWPHPMAVAALLVAVLDLWLVADAVGRL